METDRQHPVEVAIDTVKHVGSFIRYHLQGGAWAELSQYKPEPLTVEEYEQLELPGGSDDYTHE